MTTLYVGSTESRLSHPPACSAAWTDAERNRYAAWIAAITLDRIGRDDPATPVVAKAAVCELFQTTHRVLTWPAEKLERNRAALMKPYDRGLDRHGVLLPDDALAAVRGALAGCTRCGHPRAGLRLVRGRPAAGGGRRAGRRRARRAGPRRPRAAPGRRVLTA